MKIIQSNVEYLPQAPGLEGVYKQIELAGRTAYQSQDKITEDSAKTFVERMIKAKHYAALEHGTIYLALPLIGKGAIKKSHVKKWKTDPHSCVKRNPEHTILYVSTNYRVIHERGWEKDLRFICSPNSKHEKRYTFKFTTDIGVCRELLRHRKFSFLNESTRYCNYGKDKFGNELTFILPYWFKEDSDEITKELSNFLPAAEVTYLELLEHGATPEQVRTVLPLATKTELVMTGFASDWRYLLALRLEGITGKPHPDMLDLMGKLRDVAQTADIWDDIMKYPLTIK